VVIGILALLAAFLFPVLQSAREGGRHSQCLQQMRQLGQSTLAYLADFDETYPMAAYLQSVPPQSHCLFTLYHALVPYIRDKRIVVCPSDNRPVDAAAVFAQVTTLCPAMGFQHTSYMGNWCLFEVGWLPPWLSEPHRVMVASQLEYPAETLAFFEAVMTGASGFTPYLQGRHLEKAVANFADGHARTLHTRYTGIPFPRGDGGVAYIYCLLDVGPYYSGDGFCRDILFGLASKRQDGSWCWQCPGRSPSSPWYMAGNCTIE